MQVRYTPEFNKQYKKVSPKVKAKFGRRLLLFLEDSDNQLLRTHALKGKFNEYYSINVTGDVRALYKKHGADIVIFAMIGTHSQLYG